VLETSTDALLEQLRQQGQVSGLGSLSEPEFHRAVESICRHDFDHSRIRATRHRRDITAYLASETSITRRSFGRVTGLDSMSFRRFWGEVEWESYFELDN
jgi:hypothetical protein